MVALATYRAAVKRWAKDKIKPHLGAAAFAARSA
jgi:hypothetical protein